MARNVCSRVSLTRAGAEVRGRVKQVTIGLRVFSHASPSFKVIAATKPRPTTMPSSSDNDQAGNCGRLNVCCKVGRRRDPGSLSFWVTHHFDGVLDPRLNGETFERHEHVTDLLPRERFAVDDD